MAVDHDQIAALLTQARAAHQQYRDNAPRAVPNGSGGFMPSPGNPQAADAGFQAAARLLAEAHALDPHREAPEWRSAFGSKADELLAFYAENIAR